MSESKRPGDEQPMDPATIIADDLLLDALAGGDAADGDELATMLATWRAELGTAGPSMGDAESVQAVIAADREPRPSGAAPRLRARRWLPRAAATLVVAGLAVGVAVGSNHAGPTSPLWPITKVMYPQQAEVRTVEYAIERARTANMAGRYNEARRLVDEADDHIDRISAPAVAAGLRADLDTVLRDLLTATPPARLATTAAPADTPTRGTAVPEPGREPTEDPGTTGTSRGPQAPTPDLPIVPKISPAIPLPTLLPLPKPSALLPIASDAPEKLS
jgi:hypothetical protein